MDSLLSLQETMQSLTDKEFQEFISAFNRQKLSTWIFRELLMNLQDNGSTSEIAELHTIIIEIVNKSKSPSADMDSLSEIPVANNAETVSFNDLPDVSLSGISSFLSFQDQLNFEKVSRTIFIGSRSSPLPLHHLNQSMFLKLLSFHNEHPNSFLHQTRTFKSVSIDCDDLGKYQNDPNASFYGTWTSSFGSNFRLDFLQKIESLTVNGFENVQISTVIKELILNQFDSLPNLKRLDIHSEADEPFPHLQCLEALLARSDLEYFEFNGDIVTTAEFENYQWARSLRGIAFDFNDSLTTIPMVRSNVFSGKCTLSASCFDVMEHSASAISGQRFSS